MQSKCRVQTKITATVTRASRTGLCLLSAICVSTTAAVAQAFSQPFPDRSEQRLPILLCQNSTTQNISGQHASDKLSKPTESAKQTGDSSGKLDKASDSGNFGNRGPAKPGNRLGSFLNHPIDFSVLNLTDEQKQKMQQMRSENAAKSRDLRKRFKESAARMRDLMFDGTAKDDQIRAQRDQVRQLREQLEDSQLEDFLGMRSLLTSEQRDKLKDVKLSMFRSRDGGATDSVKRPADALVGKNDKDAKDVGKDLGKDLAQASPPAKNTGHRSAKRNRNVAGKAANVTGQSNLPGQPSGSDEFGGSLPPP